MSEDTDSKFGAKKCKRFCGDFFRAISTGKHNTGIYYKTKTQYSSICGGIVTLLFGVFLLGIIVNILVKVNSEEETTTLLRYEDFSF